MYGGERCRRVPQQQQQQEEAEQARILPGAFMYDVEAELWFDTEVRSSAGEALGGRSGHTATALEDGRVLVFGGEEESKGSEVRRFPPSCLPAALGMPTA